MLNTEILFLAREIPVPQNAGSCTTGCLHCLPVVSSFRDEFTSSMLGRVVDRFLFFFNNGCREDDVALSAAAHSARCLLYLLCIRPYQRIVFIFLQKDHESEPSSKVIYTYHYSSSKKLHKSKFSFPS